MKPSLLSALCAAFLVCQADAQGLLQTSRISADLANQAVAAVVTKCGSQGYAETGVLVDADGVQQAVLHGDRAGAHTLDSAFAKAYTSASFKTDTTKSIAGFFGPQPHSIFRTDGALSAVRGAGPKPSRAWSGLIHLAWTERRR